MISFRRSVFVGMLGMAVAGLAGCAVRTDNTQPSNGTDAEAGGGTGGTGTVGGAGGSGHGGTGGTSDRPDGSGTTPTDTQVRPADAPSICLSLEAGTVHKSQGESCTCASECGSNFCVDGVCCDNACAGPDGLCKACNIPTSLGRCTAVPAGLPPVTAGQCAKEDLATCGQNGMCDGTGRCQKYADSTICEPGKCSAATVVGQKSCQAGVCKAGGVTVCAPFGCNPATARCFDECAVDTDCAPGQKCEADKVTKLLSCGRKPPGMPCKDANECQMGAFCADGVCCTTACTGACVSCILQGSMGTCMPVASNVADPHAKCKTETKESCGYTGLCNGRGSCTKYTAGTVCKEASCASSGVSVPASTCNGNGSCVQANQLACFPFLCSGNGCRNKCANDSECAKGHVCTNGSCGKLGRGQKCDRTDQCDGTAKCVDGVCCENDCNGTCAYCAFPNSLGRCVSVPEGQPDPRNACSAGKPEDCGNNGLCDGQRKCELYGSDTVCRGESCDSGSNKYTPEGRCSGGSCAIPQTSGCAPFKCNGNSCAGNCSPNGQNDACTTGFCTDGSCGKKPDGQTCSNDGQCKNGFCRQGYCCHTDCSGTCQSCGLDSKHGTCTNVANGDQDPSGTCGNVATKKEDCGADGTCDGKGMCRLWGSDTTCSQATCASGTEKSVGKCDPKVQKCASSTRPCNNYMCNADVAACYTGCTPGGSECIAGQVCIDGVCGTLQDKGSSCTKVSQCKNGLFCVDGVCCDKKCDGVCVSCNLDGKAGSCSATPGGQADPADPNACPQDATGCGNDGTCSGNGGCRKFGESGSASRVCRQASCAATGNTYVPETTCSNGSCPGAGAGQSCAGSLKCDGATQQCKTSCATDADCMGTAKCVGSVCLVPILKDPGKACNSGEECASGNCVDGICCTVPASMCNGVCQSCKSGTCQAVKSAPDNDTCPNETGSNVCGRMGCDADAKCQYVSSGTSTGKAAICSNDSSAVVAEICDGTGGVTNQSMACGSGKTCQSGSCKDLPPPGNGGAGGNGAGGSSGQGGAGQGGSGEGGSGGQDSAVGPSQGGADGVDAP